jgi:two-component system alkaline phosphatase synthesis response regulator PhoP
MKRILICDDEPHVLEGLRYLLRAPSRSIIVLNSAQEAVTHVDRQLPDLLITDIMMPGMSGLELVAHLRSKYPTAELPIIIITARAQAQDGSAAAEVWGAHVVAKPFDPRAVKELVSEILGDAVCTQRDCT